MRLRARLAVVITFVLLMLGLGAGLHADAASTPPTSTNACVVVPSVQLAVCLGRF